MGEGSKEEEQGSNTEEEGGENYEETNYYNGEYGEYYENYTPWFPSLFSILYLSW